jgi:hypothetical protein
MSKVNKGDVKQLCHRVFFVPAKAMGDGLRAYNRKELIPKLKLPINDRRFTIGKVSFYPFITNCVEKDIVEFEIYRKMLR